MAQPQNGKAATSRRTPKQKRNALRANLVERAEDWRWGSLWQRRQRTLPEDYPPPSDWPLPRPRNWATLVNRAETEAELEA